MMKCLSALATGVAVAALASTAWAGPKVKLEPFVTGLNAPLAMVQMPDGRFLINEQWGRVMIADKDGNLSGVPFLDIRGNVIDRMPDFDERGLLGLALHPDFAENGKFYVTYSAPLDWQGDLAKMLWWNHNNILAEYTVSEDDPDVADPYSGRILDSQAWPQFNHNGHWIGFGPDGMLYMTMGDGGYANDWGIGHNVETGNGQDLTTPLGKVLRIDPETGEAPPDNPFVDNMEADPRIWAYGVRNPWRCSFDMGGDHELFCGDVQQNSFEEVDIIKKGGNYGWRRMEATHCFDYMHPDDHPDSCDQSELTLPIMEYRNCTAKPQGCEGISVTGGYVYRGPHEAWDGKYIFGDWSKSFGGHDGQIKFGTRGEDGKWTLEQAEIVGMDGEAPYMLGFAQDNDGNVYALTSVTTGPVGSLDTIYKIVPAE